MVQKEKVNFYVKKKRKAWDADALYLNRGQTVLPFWFFSPTPPHPELAKTKRRSSGFNELAVRLASPTPICVSPRASYHQPVY